MKKPLFIFIAAIVLFTLNTIAQTNTFPSSGNVGIGTLSPAYLLDINGSSRITNNLVFGTTNTGNIVMNGLNLSLYSYAGNPVYIEALKVGSFQFPVTFQYGDLTLNKSAGTDTWLRSSNQDLRFQSANAYNLLLNPSINPSGGYIGIGTASPTSPLHMNSNFAGDVLKITNSQVNTGVYLQNSNGVGVRLKNLNDGFIETWDGANIVTNMTFQKTTGNVGIGTTTPQYKLDVDGNVRLGHQENSVVLFPGAVSGIVKKIGESSFWALVQDPNSVFSVKKQNITGSTLYGTSDFTELFRVSNSGNVGINTTSPAEKLEVNGNIKSTGFILPTGAAAGKVLTSDASGNATWQTAASAGWSYDGNTVGVLKKIGTTDNYALPFITNNIERMRIGTNGNIGIGTANISDANYKLFVETGVRTRKVKVDQTTWADYVFHPSYKLPSLTEVETYIKQHQHLPEIPSAKEVTQNGLDLGDNQAALLKKIEELTLYLIEIKKENEQQQKEIEQLKSQITKSL